MGEEKKYCANCLKRVYGKASTRLRGRDIAWHAHCPACAELVAGQMETVLSIERARGARMEVRRCRWCGAKRTCPAGWATRCHLCRDERTIGVLATATTLVDALAQYEQPGWTVIAGDVLGLPWTPRKYVPKSHGTWGRHDACGRIQVMSRRRDKCAVCPPEPGLL